MKIRADFVTNSSSSSFILAFENTEHILTELIDEHSTCGYLERIIRDIMDEKDNQKVSQILRTYKDYAESEVEWQVIRELEKEKRITWSEAYDWKNTHKTEFGKKTRAIVKDKMDALKDAIKGKDIVVMLTYSDNDGESELEHNIMPYLKSCKAVLNNH